jgi:beta-N-acetylhexosaminidase
VRRLLDQLIQVDLQPFFAVTGEAEDPLAVADGLLVGHIRYQGFQGDNPRLPTRPISLEPGPLGALMALDALSSWRADGGLLISDSLGLRGVWRFYDPEESVFPGRRIALDAFSAGNDILYIGNYGTNPRTNQTSAVIDTIEFFIQRYESDTAFQEQVDAAVRRIITRKMALYGEFSLDAVIPAEDGLAQIGSYSAQIYDVARDGLTLLSPDLVDLPAPPQLGENIVIFTDSRSVRQCSSCAFRSIIPIDSLRSSILRFYGPDATGLVSLANVFPFSFTELADYMEREPFVPGEGENTPEPDQLELALTTADWVVFVMVQDDPAVPASLIVKQFLAEMPPSPSIKIVVLAMGSPYYLDSTEISKLSAYYALYGYTSPYIDVAARALFQELLPTGASPVSVAGIEYDILTATSPDPLQIIQISFAIEGAEEAGTAEQTAVPELIVDQGDALILTTGLIVDHNGHPVPDGTPVDFVLTYTNEGLRDTRSAVTQDGIAQISATIARPGQVLITAESGEARNSVTILLTTGSPDISVVAPELPPTSTPVPTETPLPAPTLSASPTDLTVEATPATVDAERAVSFSDLFLSMIGLSVLGAAVFAAGYLTRDSYYGGLLALAATLGGLFGYNYYALLLPGALGWREVLGETWAAALATWIGAGIGCAVAFGFYVGWQRWLVVFLRQRQRKDSSQ